MTIEIEKPRVSARTVFGKARQHESSARESTAVQERGRLFKVCPECGTKNPGSAEFCIVDGAALDGSTAQPSEPQNRVEDGAVEEVQLENEKNHSFEAVAEHEDQREGDAGLSPEIESVESVEHAPEPGRLEVKRNKTYGSKIGFLAVMAAIIGIFIWYFSSDRISDASPDASPDVFAVQNLPAIEHREEIKSPKVEVQEALPASETAVPMGSPPSEGIQAEEANVDLVAQSIENLEKSLASDGFTSAVDAEINESKGDRGAEQNEATTEPGKKTLVASDLNKDLKPETRHSELKKQLEQVLDESGMGDFKVSVAADGVVTLNGVVSDVLTKENVLMLVEQYNGVSRVRDKIFVFQ